MEAALHPAGVGGDRLLSLVGQVQLLQQPAAADRDGLPGQAAGPPPEPQVIQPSKGVVKGELLGHIGYLAHGLRSQMVFSGVRPQYPGQDGQQGALARAVGATDAQYLPLGQG